MFSRGAGNTGYVPSGGPKTDSPELAWEATVAIEQGDILSTPLIADGTVFIGGWNAIYAVRLENGQELWTQDIDHNAGFVSPALSGDFIHFGELGIDTGAISTFKRSDGSKKWRRDIRPNSSVITADGRLYVHGIKDGTDQLYGIDAETGSTEWTFDVGWKSPPTVVAAPAVGDGMVYAIAPKRNVSNSSEAVSLYGLTLEDGMVRFRYDSSVQVRSHPTFAKGTVYVGTAEGVAAVDVASGKERWTFKTPGSVRTSPATDGDAAYAVDMTSTLHGIDAANGERFWHQDIGFRADRFRSHPVLTNKTVYLGGDNLAAFSRNGDNRWTFATRAISSAFTTPAIANDCIVFASCQKMTQDQIYDNYLYALR
jgi:outer membrane protein assembly factor BamB